MGFEDYCVLVCPKNDSPLRSGNTEQAIGKLVGEVMKKWPAFSFDEIELEHLQYPKRRKDAFLVFETDQGLFQMLISLHKPGYIIFSVRFAYCNPRTIYEPFCEVVAWLMRKYKMYCQIMRDLAPQQGDILKEIDVISDVPAVLTPSMDYNRRLWQLDAETEEEAILRPGEAIARFIAPKLIGYQSEHS